MVDSKSLVATGAPFFIVHNELMQLYAMRHFVVLINQFVLYSGTIHTALTLLGCIYLGTTAHLIAFGLAGSGPRWL